MRLTLLAVLVLACGSRPDAQHPSPAPVRSRAAPLPGGPLDPTLVMRLGPAGAEKLAIATSVCAAAVSERDGALRVGCRSCPPFDASSGADGRLAELDARPETEFFELESVYRGSFMRPGADEAAAVFAGCEPHSSNWGGTLLVERSGNTWQQSSYRSGFRPRDCRTFRMPESGRDLLVCRWDTGNQGYRHTLLDTYDFAAGSAEEPLTGWTNLLALEDNSHPTCSDGELKRPIVVERLRHFTLSGATSGSPGLSVETLLWKGERTADHANFCDRLQDSAQAADAVFTPALAPHTLDFAWNGSTFAPDARTQALIDRFQLRDE
jgi:hypothetical protein